MEYDRLVKNANVDKSNAFQRSLPISLASRMEYLNHALTRWARLTGVDTLNDTMPDYDDASGRAGGEGGSGPSSMPPELKLVFALSCRARCSTLKRTMFKSTRHGRGDGENLSWQ
jgi:hypothetical protein